MNEIEPDRSTYWPLTDRQWCGALPIAVISVINKSSENDCGETEEIKNLVTEPDIDTGSLE